MTAGTTLALLAVGGCGWGHAVPDSLQADAGASMACGEAPPVPELAALHAAEQALVAAPHDPGTSLDVINPDRGVCAIRGGAGLFFARIDFKSRAACQSSCSSFSNPNRTCTWKEEALGGDPQQACRVVAGTGATLSALAAATAAQCQAACDGFQSDAYRSCDWGTERFRHPARGTECRILDGAGIDVLVPIRFSSQADCQSACDAHAADAYRRCLYGNVALQTPDPATRCELLGGAGKVLAPVFYGSQSDCSARCASFASTNPNRACYYGTTRLP
jgi:hypothetical protein